MPEEIEFRNLAASRKRIRVTIQALSTLILLLIVVGFAVYTFKPELLGPFKNIHLDLGLKNNSGYSAVFLSNGQVYFGKLSQESGNYTRLTNVYYLRVDRNLQTPQATESAQPDIALIKLGGELHGPADNIKLNKKHILFIEELKEDSRVLQSIKQHSKK